MATLQPPPSKRQKREFSEKARTQQDVPDPAAGGTRIVRFALEDGSLEVDPIEVPVAHDNDKDLSLVLNKLLGRERSEYVSYTFTRIRREVLPRGPDDLPQLAASAAGGDAPAGPGAEPDEITAVASPEDVFRVQAITREAHRIPGHGKPILCAEFSPAGYSRLATGSADHTARIWDADTGTPKYTLTGHSGAVMAVSWSADGLRLATGARDRDVLVWDPEKGTRVGNPFRGHSSMILALAWEPYHLWRDETPRLASASKDATVRIWVANTGKTEHVLSGHKGNVSCLRWGGTGLIYTGSHDKTINVWNSVEGTLVQTLTSHAHWVNHLALSTDFVLRTGYFDYKSDAPPATMEEKRQAARERFEKAARRYSGDGTPVERLVSASDDFTMYIWEPATQGKKPVARLQGHQKQVNQVTFSPDGKLLASAGWDNQTKIWDAR